MKDSNTIYTIMLWFIVIVSAIITLWGIVSCADIIIHSLFGGYFLPFNLFTPML